MRLGCPPCGTCGTCGVAAAVALPFRRPLARPLAKPRDKAGFTSGSSSRSVAAETPGRSVTMASTSCSMAAPLREIPQRVLAVRSAFKHGKPLIPRDDNRRVSESKNGLTKRASGFLIAP